MIWTGSNCPCGHPLVRIHHRNTCAVYGNHGRPPEHATGARYHPLIEAVMEADEEDRQHLKDAS